MKAFIKESFYLDADYFGNLTGKKASSIQIAKRHSLRVKNM